MSRPAGECRGAVADTAQQSAPKRTDGTISWDDWFGKFDESKLAFLYQEQHKASGEDSTFCKLVNR